MRRFVAFAVFVGLAGTPLTMSGARADEWVSTEGPSGSDVGLFESIDGRIFAGAKPALFRSLDNGDSWQLILGAVDFGGITAVGGAGDTIFVGTASGNVAKSLDGGLSWVGLTSPMPGLVVTTVKYDAPHLYAVTQPENAVNIVFPGTLWKSDDTGQSWTQLPTPNAVFSHLHVDGDLIIAQGPDLQISFVTRPFRSLDGGNTWDISSSAGFFTLGGCPIVEFGGAFYAHGSGIIRSFDMGLTWSFVQTQGLQIAGSSVPPRIVANENRIILGANPSVFQSTDGVNWSQGNVPGVLGSTPRGIVDTGAFVLLGGFYGIFRGNGASLSSWEAVNDGYTLSTVVQVAATSQGTVLAGVRNLSELARLPTGSDWQTASLLGPGADPGEIVRALRIRQLANGAALTGTQTRGIFRSVDDGASWVAANSGVPSYNGTGGFQFHEIEALAEASGVIYAGTGIGTEGASDGSQGFNTIGGGAIRSFDGGISWQAFNAGLPLAPTTGPFGEIRFDPILSMTGVENVVLAGTLQNGIRRSVAGGAWQPANTGLPPGQGQIAPTATAMLTADSVVYAGLATVVGVNVVKSLDQGLTWQSATGNLPAGVVLSLASIGDTVYAAVDTQGGFDTGVWATSDGGFFWQRVGSQLDGVLVFDLTAANQTLYAGTDGIGVWSFNTSIPSVPGDMNCDGVVNIGDVAPFALALLDAPGYQAAFPGCNINNADFSQDGSNSGADIGGFVFALTAQ